MKKSFYFAGAPFQKKALNNLLKPLPTSCPSLQIGASSCSARIPVTSRSGAFENIKNYGLQQKAALEKALSDQCLWITNASREQIQTWTKKAQISAVPSNYNENYGLVLLEMHLAGCAVISSGRGGMQEVSGPDGALYLKEVSGDAVAQALRFLINNPQERSALARRGHEYVMRHHRIDDRVAELDALRHQIIQRFKQKKGIWRRIRNLIKSSMGALG